MDLTAGSQASKKRRLFKLLMFAASTLFALALCELSLKFLLGSAESEGYFIWPRGLNVVFKPFPEIMPGVSGDTRFIVNSQGIRGDEITPQHTDRIMAVGASTTQCGYLDQTETWPYLVQETLTKSLPNRQVWVGNAGVSGLTSRHHWVAMQQLPLKEMKVETVILLMGVNDFTKRLSHDSSYDPNFLDKPEARRDLLSETFLGTYNTYPEDPFLKRTAIWQLLRKSKRLVGNKHAEDTNGLIYNAWRENRRNASEMREALPDLSTALDEYAKNINRIISVGQEKSVRLVFVTQPSLWKSDLPKNLEALLWLGGVGDFQKERGKPYYSAAALEKGMNAYNEVMLRVCRERNVECLDLAPMLEKDTTVFYDDVHFNENGARRVADIVSRHLLDRSPFRETPDAK